MCEIACCCQQSGIYVPYPLSLAKKIDETADGVNWTIDTMPSVVSSSSFSTGLLLHSPTTTLLGRRRRRKNFVRMVTRSCLDDSSALLRAAQYTVWTFNSWLPLFPTLKFCSFSCILFFFPECHHYQVFHANSTTSRLFLVRFFAIFVKIVSL